MRLNSCVRDLHDAGFPVISVGCARGRSDTPQGPQRATGERQRAERRPRLGGPEEYKRSTRSPLGGAWRRSAGMRPSSLSFPKDDLGKRLRPYFLKGLFDDHVKRYKKRPIYWLITSPKGTLQAERRWKSSRRGSGMWCGRWRRSGLSWIWMTG